jgi:uncharacterized protein (DUF885 family)
MLLSRRDLLATAGAAALAGPAFGATSAPTANADTRLNTLFNGLTEQMLNDSPEGATFLGLDKGPHAALKSKLGDESWAFASQDHVKCADWLGKLGAIPDAQLSPAAALNKSVVEYALTLGKDAGAFPFGDNDLASAMGESSSPYVVSQQNGNFVGVPEFLDAQHKIETKADADAYLARVKALAVTLDQETDRVKRDAGQGVVLPDFLGPIVLGEMEAFVKVPAAKSRLVSSLVTRAKAKGIAGDYATPAAKLVESEVYPALARQMAALKDAARKATHDAGVWRFKDGQAYYAWALRVGTTTELSPDEVHKTGLAQNDLINARMDAILKTQGLTTGSVGERMTALGKDPKNLFPDTDAGRAELLQHLNDLIAGMRPKLADAFRLKLKAPVQVRRVPPDIQDGGGLGYMNPGALDGSRPSTYYINLKSTSIWPRYALPTLTYHETIPGHAWQGAYLTETGKLPLIRVMLSGFNAYVEGWALYCEQLADELGMYANDPLGRLGYLQAQKFRACRLVVDTGLHAMRWTREQAIDWMVANTGRTRQGVTSEIHRYCASPGQACGYKIGQLEILDIRAKAKAALGPKFDLRDFDDWVVEAGAVPISVLASYVSERVAEAQKA